MTMSVVTSVKTVGSKKVPPSAERLPPVTTLAPFFTASAICASTFSTCGKGCGGRWLEHHRAAGGQCRARLAGDHRRREVPRGDRRAHADRLLGHDNALVGGVRRDRVAIDALALLAEPLDEGRGIGDLAARLGHG